MSSKELAQIIKASNFKVHSGIYIYSKVNEAPNINDCFLITKDDDEITAVFLQENAGNIDVVERNKDNYRLLELKVSLPFYAVGFIAAVTKAISQKGCNNLVVSTYSKDYILVRVEQLDLALQALQEIGLTKTK